MSKEVLLLADVADLGSEGDVVDVSDGYARNFLIPRDLAAPVNAATHRRLAKIREKRAEELKARLADAQAMAERLARASCTLTVKTGEDDKLYGSVTSSDIAKSLAEQGVDVDRHDINLEHPIKELGCYDVKVRLHPEVEGSIKVWVVEE